MSLLRNLRLGLMVFLSKVFGKKYKASICGHKTKLLCRVSVFGKELICKLKENPEYCANCLAKMSIRCAWCGSTILPGGPVTLYEPKKDFKIPDYAVFYKKDPSVLVGCLRWDCEGSPGASGFWVVPGKVDRAAGS